MARLERLQRILAHARNGAPVSSDSDPAAVHLNSFATERIRDLTAELRGQDDTEFDTIDTLTIRLLLDEYATAVGHLRAVARLAAARVDAAAMPMKEARRALHRLTKERAAKIARAEERERSDVSSGTERSPRP